MSRITYFDEKEIEKEKVDKLEECRYKVNGICYNNYGSYLKLGKKCHYIKNTCTFFIEERRNGRK